MATNRHEDSRFTVPLYSVPDAARYLTLPRSTLKTWVDGRLGFSISKPLATSKRPQAKYAEQRIPFIELAEAYVPKVFRRVGVPLQRIRPSLDVLKGLFTDDGVVSHQRAEPPVV